MPSVFLSPSTQEYNLYVNGGTEEYYANLIADAMVPYLRASGITFSRNNPGGTVSNSIADSNAGNVNIQLIRLIIYPAHSIITVLKEHRILYWGASR